MEDLKDADAVTKLMREILDTRHFKGQPIINLNRKRLLKVLAILITYTKFTESKMSQLYATLAGNTLQKEKEEKETPDEQTS